MPGLPTVGRDRVRIGPAGGDDNNRLPASVVDEIVPRSGARAGLFDRCPAPARCHNDFHEGNVLVDPNDWRVTGFIDMENAIAADMAALVR